MSGAGGGGRGVDRLDPVDRIDRQRVRLGAVVAGTAADEVALAVAGEQPIVAVLAVEEVAAPAAGQGVVAGPADKAVCLVGAAQLVVARAAIGGDEQTRQARRDRELVVAAAAVDRQRLGGEVDREGTRFVRVKSTRPAFGAAVKMSPAVAAPLISTVSARRRRS